MAYLVPFHRVKHVTATQLLISCSSRSITLSRLTFSIADFLAAEGEEKVPFCFPGDLGDVFLHSPSPPGPKDCFNIKSKLSPTILAVNFFFKTFSFLSFGIFIFTGFPSFCTLTFFMVGTLLEPYSELN